MARQQDQRPFLQEVPYVVEFEHRAGYLYAHAQAQKDSLEYRLAIGLT